MALIGDSEMLSGQIALKDMVQGTQESLTLDALIEKMKSQTR